MNFNFIIDYPWWFILLCIAVGAIVAAILYYKNRSDDFQPWLVKLLAGFRFVTITVLCFLLLAPLIELRVTQRQEPVILVFQDNSQSLSTGRNATFMQNEYPARFEEFVGDLAANYNVNTYTFGERVQEADSISLKENITNMAEIFTSLDVLYSNRNVGAVIIASDGIFNQGINPAYQASGTLFPVYTLALGDTVPQRDLIINRIRHNRITYLNNLFPLEITVEARRAAGQRSRVRVFDDDLLVAEEDISITNDQFFKTITLELEALEVGIKRYRIELDPIADEISLENNIREFFIEVIDSRQKILILANSPHPDVGAIKLALDENENFETQVALIGDFDEDVRDYDLIIWHQLPSLTQSASSHFRRAGDAAIPQLFVLGAQSNISAFNQLQTGVSVNVRSPGFTDSRAELNNDFTLFQPGIQASELLPEFPPLQTPFATYRLSPGTQVLAFQRIGNVTTDYPLIALTQTSEQKTGFVAGEGMWRWRLSNFARTNNHIAFNETLSRIIQFLTVVEDRSFFRVTTENFLMENQPALFEAELYNRSYELVNEPDVSMTITNEDGEEFNYTFARSGNAYRLNAGIFPVGEYSYNASVPLGNEDFTASGIFTVSPLNLEGINTIANHQLLFQLAENTGGKMFFPAEMDELLSEIRSRQDIRPVLYSQNQYEDIVNLRWIFFLLLLLLATEWFIRKYNGAY